jgi:hypothetical protein
MAAENRCLIQKKPLNDRPAPECNTLCADDKPNVFRQTHKTPVFAWVYRYWLHVPKLPLDFFYGANYGCLDDCERSMAA